MLILLQPIINVISKLALDGTEFRNKYSEWGHLAQTDLTNEKDAKTEAEKKSS